MENAIDKPDEIKRLHELFVNDKIIASLINQKSFLMVHSMPKGYIIEGDDLEIVYEEEVQKELKSIDKMLDNYIKQNY